MNEFVVATRMPNGKIATFISGGPDVAGARNEVRNYMAAEVAGFDAEKFSCVVSIPDVGRDLKPKIIAHRAKDPLQHALDVVCETEHEGSELD